jgi:N-methylhydantoinase A
MRYAGQAYELPVPLPDLSAGIDPLAVAELFHEAHERVYGFRDAQSPIEITTIRLGIIGKVPPIVAEPATSVAGAPVPHAQRTVFHRGHWIEAQVYRRGDLHPGQDFAGPALVEQEDTTTWILPGWRVGVDKSGNLHVQRA